jgi:hypothetical protein
MKKTRIATKRLKLNAEAIRLLAATSLSVVIGGRRNDEGENVTCDAGGTCPTN